MWGTFTSRFDVCTFTFKPDQQAEKKVCYFSHPPPVLDHVLYLVATHSRGERLLPQIKLLDAKRKKWSDQMSREIMGNICTLEEAIEKAKTKYNQAFIDWRDLDFVFHLELLFPEVSFAKKKIAIKQINNGNWEGIITKLVPDPLFLKRYLPPDSSLLAEAVVMHILTKTMKVFKCVWMTEEKLGQAFFQTRDLALAATRLKQAGVIVFDNDRCALKWAADLAVKFTNHTKHASSILPCTDPNCKGGDYDMAVDSWVDERIVVCTMIHEHPGTPLVWRKVTSLKEAMKLAREASQGGKCLLFSPQGRLVMSGKETMCLVRSTVLRFYGFVLQFHSTVSFYILRELTLTRWETILLQKAGSWLESSPIGK